MVRLREIAQSDLERYKYKFQFHYGAIKGLAFTPWV
mgnify:FL=1